MRDSVLELNSLYSEFGTDPDLAEIVDMFVDEMPLRTTALNGCLDDGAWDELGRLAHQLKGACGSYGFHQLTPFAALLETACRTNDRNEVEIRQAAETLIELCSRCRKGAPQ